MTTTPRYGCIQERLKLHFQALTGIYAVRALRNEPEAMRSTEERIISEEIESLEASIKRQERRERRHEEVRTSGNCNQ